SDVEVDAADDGAAAVRFGEVDGPQRRHWWLVGRETSVPGCFAVLLIGSLSDYGHDEPLPFVCVRDRSAPSTTTVSVFLSNVTRCPVDSRLHSSLIVTGAPVTRYRSPSLKYVIRSPRVSRC